MNEHYLQWIWNQKRLPFHALRTTSNQHIVIHKVGEWNHHSGPDFFAGEIELDGLKLHGNIEIHVKASDWMKHGHQHDSAYSNVILHVVYEADLEIVINETPLPTIELKTFIDWKHFKRFASALSSKEALVCSNFLSQIPGVVFWDEVLQNAWQRFSTKSKQFENLNDQSNFREILFRFIAKSFGMKVNNMAFEELSNRIPVKRLLKLNSFQKQAVVVGVSGLLSQKKQIDHQLSQEFDFQAKRLGLQVMQERVWKSKGNRPSGFPLKRLLQFAHFIDSICWDADFWNNQPLFIVQELQGQLMKTFQVGEEQVKGMSKQTANVVLVNSVVPFLWWLATKSSERIYVEKAMEIVQLLPAEKNERIAIWKKQGWVPSSSLESQGLLELLNEKCAKKQCLNCKIGRYAFQ